MQWGKLHRSAVPTLAGNNESVSCLKALGYCPSHARWKNSISSRQSCLCTLSPRCSPVSPTVCPGMEVGKQVASAIKSSSCNYCHKNEQNAARRARHKKMWPRMNVMLPLPPLPGGAGWVGLSVCVFVCECGWGVDAQRGSSASWETWANKKQGKQIHIAVTDTATDTDT